VSDIIASLSTFAALMAGISVAVERVVEMIKGFIPGLANSWPKHDELRCGTIQLIASAAGMVIAAMMPAQVKSALPAGLNMGVGYPMYVVIGLMSSGGSGAWNHLLDILGALKEKQETSASQAKAAIAVPGQ
jgi:hypothetical protein